MILDRRDHRRSFTSFLIMVGINLIYLTTHSDLIVWGDLESVLPGGCVCQAQVNQSSQTTSIRQSRGISVIRPFNPGFEELSERIEPAGWTGDNQSGSVIKIDSSQVHSGRASLKMEHISYGRSMRSSRPIRLETGRLYRLSGWIRTEQARTAPSKHYPTPVPACLRMESMPITAYSQPVGGTREWCQVEVLFFATRDQDRIQLWLGYQSLSGDSIDLTDSLPTTRLNDHSVEDGAIGTAWFDDIEINPIDDITAYLPAERIQSFGPAFRFEEQGWIYLHVEGSPYDRGYQHGVLAADEIKTMITKLGTYRNRDNPGQAWKDVRSQVDMLFLRKYDPEYLTEMKGIADGVRHTNLTVFERPIDLLDIVSLNSYIDLAYAADGINKTPHALSGKNFQSPDYEMDLPERLHKCSGFLANHSATADHRIVFGQLFMWNGYMGPDWNMIIDLVPKDGERLVYESFPGGIHSGADFYINSAGIMIGETTVNQTPFNPEGIPQSNRIRKAAQYARSIDDVVGILSTRNNGMYTNDWLIGDTKSDEIAVFCLGTTTSKLWRSKNREFYGGQIDWYWSNNNPKSLEIRQQYIANADNAPFDLSFRPWDRDMVFWNFYQQHRGMIDAVHGMQLCATSPINRPHACDGKITTSEMAEKLMFHAHYGKVTLREQFVNENGRIPDLPLAIPRLALGYTTFSPLILSDMIQSLPHPDTSHTPSAPVVRLEDGLDSLFLFHSDQLWSNTLYPSSNRENWLISATAAYWQILHGLPETPDKARESISGDLADQICRLLYTQAREGCMVPLEAQTVYHQTKHYYIPKIRGCFLLHQLRLTLGNQCFSIMMKQIHDQYNQKPITTEAFIRMAETSSGRHLKPLIMDWIDREDLPNLHPSCRVSRSDSLWLVQYRIEQSGQPYHLQTTVRIETDHEVIWKRIELSQSIQEWTWALSDQPREITLNPGNDIPLPHPRYYTFTNFYDDFHQTLIVYGTTRQIEANHTLALRFSRTAADRFTEILLPVRKDCELDSAEFADHDILLLGGIEDNQWTQRIAAQCGLSLGRGFFRWRTKTYAESNQGLMIVLPNPYNPNRMLTILAANSALQLYQMTRNLPKIPSWAIYTDDRIIDKGRHETGISLSIDPAKTE